MQAEPHTRVNKLTGKILLGHVSGLFGVKGWVKIFSYTRPRVQICNYRDWYLAKNANTEEFKEVHLEDGRAHKEGVIAKFKNIDDRDLAAALLDYEIWVDESELSALEEGEYYWHQLIGLEVFDAENFSFGKVENLLETGANDVLIVRDENTTERLIPYIKDQVIKSIDLDAKRIVVDWDKEF